MCLQLIFIVLTDLLTLLYDEQLCNKIFRSDVLNHLPLPLSLSPSFTFVSIFGHNAEPLNNFFCKIAKFILFMTIACYFFNLDCLNFC